MIMNNTFNLTPCKKLSLRHRTLAGKTVYYHTYFEPKGLDKAGRRYAIDEFKHPSSLNNKAVSEMMIDYALYEFFKMHDINEFDVIAGIPSSSRVVRKILNNINKLYPNKLIIPKLFDKTRMRNVSVNQRMIFEEASLKTHEKAAPALFESISMHYDKVAKVSLFPTRFRRYVDGFLKLNEAYLSVIKDKRVLLVDDTFGEGLTLCESSNILKKYVKSVIAFTVLKDYSTKRK